MDYKDLTRLIVKVFGALVFVEALTSLPAQIGKATFYGGWQTFVTYMAWPLAFPAAVAAVLFFRPGVISDRILRGDSLSTSPEACARVQHIALCVLGIYLLFDAIGDLGFAVGQIGSLQLLSVQERTPPILGMMHAELYGALVGGVAQFAASIALMAGGEPIRR